MSFLPAFDRPLPRIEASLRGGPTKSDFSEALLFGRLWYGAPDAIANAIGNAIGYAKHRSRSHDAVIRVNDEAGQRNRDARAHWRFQGVVSARSNGLRRRSV
jgi:hypothetical protein